MTSNGWPAIGIRTFKIPTLMLLSDMKVVSPKRGNALWFEELGGGVE